MISRRWGKAEPFANINSREDGRYGGIQIGFTTYHTPEGGEEEYQTSYFEVGSRVDNLSNPLMDLDNNERKPLTVANPLNQDAARVSSAPVDVKVKADAEPRPIGEVSTRSCCPLL